MANQIRIPLILFVVSLAIFLVGNGSHALWDRDEPRYGVATREMLERGDFVVPHFNGGIRYDKPVLIYWLMAVPMKILGVNEFSARLVSGLAGALRVVLIYLFALRLGCHREGAVLAAVVSAFGVLGALISKAATIDSALVLTIVAALWLYWERLRHGFSWGKHLLFWGVLAASILLKGPPGPAIVGLAIITFHLWMKFGGDGDAIAPGAISPVPARITQSLVGLLFLVCLVLPWVWLAWERTDGGFFRVSIGKHVIERSRSELEGHGGPFFYYLLALVPATFPFSGALWSAGRWGLARHHRTTLRFLWAWFLPGLIMFSLVKTKLPHYIAPLIPALGLMAGLWWSARIDYEDDAEPKWSRLVGALLVLVPGSAAAIALVVYPPSMDLPFSMGRFTVVSTIVGASTLAGACFWLMRRDVASLLVLCFGWLAAIVLGLVWLMPLLDSKRPSRQLGLWLRENAPPTAHLMMVEFEEPSLVFYAGREIEDIGKGDRVAAFSRLNDVGSAAALITTRDRWEKFQSEYREKDGGEVGSQVRSGLRVRAFQFEQGRWMDLRIICNWPDGSDAPPR